MSDVTEVGICNSALLKIGLERIISLADINRRAILCNDEYPKQRDYVLRSHPWNFATKRAKLATIITPPVYEFTNAFQLPADWLRVIDIPRIQHPYRIEGGLLLTNDATIQIRYIARVTDPSQYDYNFADALAYRLASVLAYPLVQSVELAANMMKVYDKVMAETKSFNAQEGLPVQLQVDEFLNSRF